MITRYVLVNYYDKIIHDEAFASKKDAWRKAVELCRGTDTSPYTWDICEISVNVS